MQTEADCLYEYRNKETEKDKKIALCYGDINTLVVLEGFLGVLGGEEGGSGL